MSDPSLPPQESFGNDSRQKEQEFAKLLAQLELYVRKSRLGWLGPLLTFLAFWALNGGHKRALILWKIHGAGTALLLAALISGLYFLVNVLVERRTKLALERMGRGVVPDRNEQKRLRFLHSQILPLLFVMLVFGAGILVTRPPERPFPPESRLPLLETFDRGAPQTHYRQWREWSAPLQEELTQVITGGTHEKGGEDVAAAAQSLQFYSLRKAEDAGKLFHLLEREAAVPLKEREGQMTLEPMTRQQFPGRSGQLLSLGRFLDPDGKEFRCAVLCQGKNVLLAYYSGAADEAVWLDKLAECIEEMPEQ